MARSPKLRHRALYHADQESVTLGGKTTLKLHALFVLTSQAQGQYQALADQYRESLTELIDTHFPGEDPAGFELDFDQRVLRRKSATPTSATNGELVHDGS